MISNTIMTVNSNLILSHRLFSVIALANYKISI